MEQMNKDYFEKQGMKKYVAEDQIIYVKDSFVLMVSPKVIGLKSVAETSPNQIPQMSIEDWEAAIDISKTLKEKDGTN